MNRGRSGVGLASLVLGGLLHTTGCSGCSEPLGGGGGSSGASGPTHDSGSTGGQTTINTGGQPTAPSSATSAATAVDPTTRDTDSTGTDASDDTSPGTTAVYLDLPPFPAECYEPNPTIIIERAESPEGTLVFDEAWQQNDYCGYDPAVRLRDNEADIDVVCVVDGVSPRLGLHGCVYHSFRGAETVTIDVLEPYDDPDFDNATQGVHLHGILEAYGGGWDVRVEVDVQECGEWTCYCPCE